MTILKQRRERRYLLSLLRVSTSAIGQLINSAQKYQDITFFDSSNVVPLIAKKSKYPIRVSDQLFPNEPELSDVWRQVVLIAKYLDEGTLLEPPATQLSSRSNVLKFPSNDY